ncbi:hypothetical protein BASA81_011378 [Batrachochytrium salamandrivorans]|nr:hypothetical protein BASA81_011378 [Batrachochytrium salamandrivorans]
MISILAITVSAWPPHNPDTQNTSPSPDDAIQNMEQSQGISAENIQYFQEFDVEMLEEFLNDITQNMNQPQDAGTQNSQQPQDAGTQSVQQSPDAYAQSAHQYRDVSAQDGEQSQNYGTQMLEEFLDATTQNAQQPQGAATHSAQQSPGSTSQDIHEFQGISTQSAQRSDQDKVRVAMNRLMEAYEIQDGRCSQIDIQINTDKQRDTKARDMMKRIAMKLRETGLSDHERLELKKTARNLRMMADELTTGYQEQRWYYINSMTMRSYVHAELQILNDNQKLIVEHNSKNVAQVELSPNSCYNTGILEKQYDKVLKDIGELLAEQKKIRGAMLLPGGDALKAKSKQLDSMIRILQHYNVVARRILWQHMYSQPLGAGISESLDLYMQNIKI